MAFKQTLATLAVNLTANASQFESGFGKAEGTLNRFARTVDKVGRSTRAAGKGGGPGMLNSMLGGIASKASMVVGVLSTLATATSAFVAGLGAVVVTQTSRIDEMLGSALQLGVAVQVFQGLDIAASRAGLGMGELTAGLGHVHDMLNGTSQEAQRTQAMISSLGVDPSSLQGLTADQEVDSLSQLFRTIEDPAARAQLAFDLFGEKWAKFLRMMDTDIMFKVAEDLEKTGVALTSLDFAKAEMFQDSWARLKNVVDGVFKKLSTELSPAFQALIEMLIDATASAGGFGDTIGLIGDAFAMVIKSALTVGDVLAGAFSVLLTGVSFVAAEIGKFFANLTGNQAVKDFAAFAEQNAKMFNDFAHDRFDSAFSGSTRQTFDDKLREIEARAQKRAKELEANTGSRPDKHTDADDTAKKKKEVKPQELGALIRGSTEAFKAVQESQKINQLLAVETKSERHLSESKGHLGAIRHAITSGIAPTVATVPVF